MLREARFKRKLKAALTCIVITVGFGIYAYADWTLNFTGPQRRTERSIRLDLAPSNDRAVFNFTLSGFRERVDVSIMADQLVCAYIMDEENFYGYTYCMESTWDCPSFISLDWFEFELEGSLQATQARWKASTLVETGYHLLVMGPDFAMAHVTVSIVEYHW